MLVLTRKKGEGLVIDGTIRVSVVAIRGGRVHLGINAPQGLAVVRDDAKKQKPKT